MQTSRLYLPLILLGAFGSHAQAQYRDSPFSYNYLDINWATTEISDQASQVGRLDGFGGRLSFDSPEGVRIILAYDETETNATIPGNPGTENFSLLRQDLEAGVGFITSPADTTDLVLDIKYLRGEWRRPVWDSSLGLNGGYKSRNRTQNGYGIEFGIRSLFTDYLEFDVSAEYREFYSSEIGGHGALVLMFTENFGIQSRYTWFQSQQLLTAGLRLAM